MEHTRGVLAKGPPMLDEINKRFDLELDTAKVRQTKKARRISSRTQMLLRSW
ncbi:unnamed protein product [Prunus brigantina]